MTGAFHLDARRFARDTLVGLALFSLALFAVAGGSAPAGAVAATVLSFAEQRWLPLLLIAGMFSLFLAFNLALYRHIGRVCAEDRVQQAQSMRSGRS
jgi:hypothetical protein